MTKKPSTATASATAASAMPVELTDRMLDMVSGGDNGLGQTMGPMLAGAGGMSGMADSMGKTPADMGPMLGAAGGMRNAMTSGQM